MFSQGSPSRITHSHSLYHCYHRRRCCCHGRCFCQAYTKVAPAVAAFPEYCLPLAKQLVHAQLRHWEKSLRELAARGLAALATSEAGPYLATEGLDTLLPLCLDPVSSV